MQPNQTEKATESAAAASTPATQAPAAIITHAPQKSFKERLRLPLMLAFPLMLVAAGGIYYFAEAGRVSTDDAFVRAAKESVNARVSGQVTEIAVRDNQPVKRGQLLFRIDPEPYQIAIDQAEAMLAGARMQIESLKATYQQQQAELQSAKDSAAYEEHEYDRKKALMASDFTSKSDFEHAETIFKVARQNIAAIEQQITNTVAALNGDPNIEVTNHPTVRAAKAGLDRAQLQYSYTAVHAPDDGIVANVDDLQAGDFVNAGAAVFSLLASERIWIEANFRETDLTHMRPGQTATIRVDAYPGKTFTAHITSLSPGTGSDFSVLPPENATGNWVKVIQRLPVRLELEDTDPEHPLFSGISVTVRVNTAERGTERHPLQAKLSTEGTK